MGDKFPKLSDVKDVSLFLTIPNCLGMDKGMGLYVKSGSNDWGYRGYVSSAHPSEVMPLQVEFIQGVNLGPIGHLLWGLRPCFMLNAHIIVMVIPLDALVALESVRAEGSSFGCASACTPQIACFVAVPGSEMCSLGE